MPASSEQNNVNFVIFINRKCIKAIYSVKTNKQTKQIDLRVDRVGLWFEHSMSYLWVCLSGEDAKNVS